MKHPENAAAPVEAEACGESAAEEYVSKFSTFETEARAILEREAIANNWPAGTWEKYIGPLAYRLANPRVKRRRAVLL